MTMKTRSDGESNEESGTCLMHKRSSISRKTSHPESLSLIELSNTHKMWRSKTSALYAHIMSATGILDDFINKQKKSGDACSARLLDAKRGYDGLLKDVKLISEQIDAHEKVMEAENADLSATMDSIKEVEATFKEDMEKCSKEHAEALADKATFEAELKELQQIAKPAVRYQDATVSNTMAKVKSATDEALEKHGGFEP